MSTDDLKLARDGQLEYGKVPSSNHAWVRSANVRAVAERLPPWKDYRLKGTGQRCRVKSYGEVYGDNGETPTGAVTVTIFAWRDEMPELTLVEVFGINPDDLTSWTEGSIS